MKSTKELVWDVVSGVFMLVYYTAFPPKQESCVNTRLKPFQVVLKTEDFEPGWYYYDQSFEIHGPYKSKEEAMEKAHFAYIFGVTD